VARAKSPASSKAAVTAIPKYLVRIRVSPRVQILKATRLRMTLARR